MSLADALIGALSIAAGAGLVVLATAGLIAWWGRSGR